MKIAFLGDSITYGVGCSREENRYTDVFARLSGAEVLNFGISGSRIAKQKKFTPGWEDFDDRAYVDRYVEIPTDVDMIVIFGGTNDFGHGDGDLGDMHSTNPYTFYGAMHTLCRGLMEKYPTAEIVFLTPLHRSTENVLVNEIGMPTAPLSAYVNAIREVCEYYSLKVVDLFRESGMQPAVPENKERYMPDGLHPSDAGAEKLAKFLYRELRHFFD